MSNKGEGFCERLSNISGNNHELSEFLQSLLS